MRSHPGLRPIAALAVAMLLAALPARGQSGGNFSMTKSTWNGSGGPSAGGNYSVATTLGNADAGQASGGSYGRWDLERARGASCVSGSGRTCQYSGMDATRPRWPERVRELARELRGATRREVRQELLGRAWLLLASGLDLQVARHAARLGPLGPEDREDVVSDKASDLLRRLDEGVWRPEDEPAAKTVAFVSTLARNGVVDWLRRSGPRVRAELDPEREESRDAGPAAQAESRAFAAALLECASALRPRARVVWFLRVFHELPSKVIADHPEVEMTLPNVDVTLLRSRRSLKRCMEAKGFDVKEMPRGAFEELWIAFRAERGPGERG